jgi:IS30 family transposase
LIAEPLGLSLTCDQDKEMAYHRQLTGATNVTVSFYVPHRSRQRVSNENTNDLADRSFSDHTQVHHDAINDEINGRPRKVLDLRRITCPEPATPVNPPLIQGVALQI